MSQLGEFLATIQNKQDARTAELEARLAELESKEECGCAETISTLEARLATLESKEECGCAETISTLEARLAELESKEECGCGSYDELLASYEQRISALEGNTGGGTEGEGGEEGGSTEGEGGEEGGSTEPIPASQALEEYNHLIGFYNYNGKITARFISAYTHMLAIGDERSLISSPNSSVTVAKYFTGNEEGNVKVYTPDLQEIEIISDTTLPYYYKIDTSCTMAIGNLVTKEVHYCCVDCDNMTVSPCTDEAFIAQWDNSTLLDW